ncbi:MAG: hypothetical protein NBV67_02395 [Tagaea sp.]|nr:hypothetical protein [Tagaea sp.]
MEFRIDYEPDGATLERFLVSGAPVKGIIGPWGSGKSRASCVALAMNVARQPVSKSGKRRRRTLVTRQTYAELHDTTIKTWLEVFPENVFGAIARSRPFRHYIRVADLDWEVIFLALEGEDDRKKLLSLDLSDAWVNEARETARGIVDDITGRLGRFPPVADGGCFQPQLLLDSNAPGVEHYLAVMAGMAPMPQNLSSDDRQRLTKPSEWDLLVQPPGLIEDKDAEGNIRGYRPNPLAENTRWLRPNYYLEIIKGKDQGWIDVNVMNRPGQPRAGRTVYPMFVERVHVARQRLEFLDGHTLFVGVDFGRTPAAVVGQRVFDRWRILGELCAEDMGARAFARILKRWLAERFPLARVSMWGDPAGNAKGQVDDTTPFQAMRAEGLEIYPASTNDASVRRGAVEEALRAMDGEGNARFLLDGEACPILRAGFQSGYHFRKLQVSGAELYADEPEKNRFSHPHDALQYLMIGAGEGRAFLGRAREAPAGAVRAAKARKTTFDRRRAG